MQNFTLRFSRHFNLVVVFALLFDNSFGKSSREFNSNSPFVVPAWDSRIAV